MSEANVKRHGVKVGPGPPSKFKSGIRDPPKV